MEENKKIYYVLDAKHKVTDFTESETENLYGTIPVEMTIEDLKKVLDFDNRDYFYKDFMLTSVPKSQQTDLEHLLAKQIQANADQVDFLRDLVAEMAEVVYAE